MVDINAMILTFLFLVNQQRALNHLPLLIENQQLEQAAEAKANDEATKGYFSHISPNGKLPWDFIHATGYQYQFSGENLADGFSDASSTMTAWMNSPMHKANILDSNYTQIGIGIAEGIYQGKEQTFVVEFFAAPEKTVHHITTTTRDIIQLPMPILIATKKTSWFSKILNAIKQWFQALLQQLQ